jgi:hypothetical protein
LQKDFDTVIREALWWKLSKKGTSTKFIERIKALYRNAKITIKFEGRSVSEELIQILDYGGFVHYHLQHLIYLLMIY